MQGAGSSFHPLATPPDDHDWDTAWITTTSAFDHLPDSALARQHLGWSDRARPAVENVNPVVEVRTEYFPHPTVAVPTPKLVFDFRMAARLSRSTSRDMGPGAGAKNLTTTTAGRWSGSFGCGLVTAGGHDLQTQHGERTKTKIDTAWRLETIDDPPVVLDMRTRGYISFLTGSLSTFLDRGADSDPQVYVFRMAMSLRTEDPRYAEQLNLGLWIGSAAGRFCAGWTLPPFIFIHEYRDTATTLAFKITATYRKEYFINTISKPISFYDEERHSVGGLTAAVASDPTQLQQLLGTNMGFALISVLSVTGCLTISFYFGWKLTLVALSCSLPIVLAAGFFRIRYEAKFEAMNRVVFAESAKFATEAVGACRTVTALTMEVSILRKYDALLAEHVKNAFKKARFSTLLFAASDSMPLLCMAFVLWYGGRLLADQEYNAFQYLVVYIAVVQGGIGAGQWLSFAPNIAQATAAANRILSMRVKEKARSASLPVGASGSDTDEKGVRLEFCNVWFRYPTRDAPVLNGLNLTVEKGQFAAIVGASGAGKTSIISLLERFYTVKAGSITYDGVDINDLDLGEYRKSISLVAQESAIFTGTIRQNIIVGVDEASVTDEDIHQVCHDADIHDFIISLPDGYNTLVGLRGVLLSGGQKQRIAIARALIRKPRLLLLDEATSNLDSETEKSVQRVFERTKKERTMVVVAHRLATIQNADVIYVLGDGQVVESGNHASLLGKRGTYYHMCLSQALDR